MTKLEWHKPGERGFEAGCDRGVLYLGDDSGVPWNGLRSVDEESSGITVTPLFFEGVKYGEIRTPGDYAATLKAFTYPPQFGVFDGVQAVSAGLNAHDQMVDSYFGLSYRTLMGDDLEGLDKGYKVHILYNLTAMSEGLSRASNTRDTSLADFTWKISGVPVRLAGFRPTVHFSLDSTVIHPELMAILESILYGGATTDPRLPDISELQTLIDNWDLITITDNGDGTWTATGPDEYITMLNPTTFKITDASAVYLDAHTYTISSA